MTPLSFSDVTLTPPLVSRWQDEVRSAVARLRASGVTAQHGMETLHALADGRLRMCAEYAPGFSIVMHAEAGEWCLVSNN